METFWPALLGALAPVLLAGLAFLVRFGKVEQELKMVSFDGRSLAEEVSGIRRDIRDAEASLRKQLHETEVAIVDRVSRIEGLIEAQRRSTS